MILEDETFKKFGYYPRDLKPKSNKRILAACDDCGKIREIYESRYRALCPSCARKGKCHSDETKKKMSNASKGENNSNFGKSPSEATKQKLSDANKGQKRSDETKKKMSNSKKGENHPLYGKHLSDEHRRKISCVTKGERNPNFGKRHSDKVKKKMSDALKGKCTGENNPNWRGGRSIKYCSKWTEKFREYIRNKFNRECFLCGKTEAENWRKLSVHHVSYDKACGCAETEEEKKAEDTTCQFVPLCVSCHTKTNYNRDYWRKRIIRKLHENINGWFI